MGRSEPPPRLAEWSASHRKAPAYCRTRRKGRPHETWSELPSSLAAARLDGSSLQVSCGRPFLLVRQYAGALRCDADHSARRGGGSDRPIGLRQIDVLAQPESDERPY